MYFFFLLAKIQFAFLLSSYYLSVTEAEILRSLECLLEERTIFVANDLCKDKEIFHSFFIRSSDI